MQQKDGLWRHPKGWLPNSLALGYVGLGQIIGIGLLSSSGLATWLVGIILVAHSLVIAAYFIHELAHNSIFNSRRLSLTVGEILSWLCGAAYAPMSRIKRMHMRHHGDIADLALFDPRPFLAQSPAWFRRCVYLLEWCYIPAVELIMHYNVVTRPFLNTLYASDRTRVIIVGLSRATLFAGLFLVSPWALFGYGIAYCLMLIALFLADAYAHTYEYYLVHSVDEKVPRNGRDRDYDRLHTYSNLVSERWPWLNLLNLNFGYHNAHHASPIVPWYDLPRFHKECQLDGSPQVLPYREVWRTFHQNRLKRIEAEDPGDVGTGQGRADHFLGVHGVSFLSIV